VEDLKRSAQKGDLGVDERINNKLDIKEIGSGVFY
jgi:hypothetical protein